jgi:hypothetical protein
VSTSQKSFEFFCYALIGDDGDGSRLLCNEGAVIRKQGCTVKTVKKIVAWNQYSTVRNQYSKFIKRDISGNYIYCTYYNGSMSL